MSGDTASGERYATMRRVTVLGGALDLVLGVAKILGGLWTHSQSLVADGVHSLSDLATDVAPRLRTNDVT